MADGPRINDQLPIRERLSPPIVAISVPECTVFLVSPNPGMHNNIEPLVM